MTTLQLWEFILEREGLVKISENNLQYDTMRNSGYTQDSVHLSMRWYTEELCHVYILYEIKECLLFMEF